MAYSNFTLEEVLTVFRLEIVESIGVFSNIEPVAPSAALAGELKKKAPVAAAINTDMVEQKA